MTYDIVFPQKMVPECKPEWNREAIRLPSLRRLQATPLLQTSLFLEQCPRAGRPSASKKQQNNPLWTMKA